MSMVGPSGSRKSFLIYQMPLNGIFFPIFDKILYFYQHFQSLYNEMTPQIPNIAFINNVDFEIVRSLPNDGRNYLMIFDDSCKEITKINV